ncbi:MAG: site-2 protease family protein [Planctomycetaceae bacterium]|nr:site-2 protease family protein [Planctomycetaceae bacterium]
MENEISTHLKQTPGDFETDEELLDDSELILVQAPPSRPRFAPRYPTDRSKRVAMYMLLATIVSMFWVGMRAGAGPILPQQFFAVPQYVQEQLLFSGGVYAGALLLILGCHEMGHYLQARRYGVAASFPFFIPMPISPFGTMGAVIIQGDHAGNRKTLFDIAVSGPLAGLVAAIPILYFGLAQAHTELPPEDFAGVVYGDPLIVEWMFEAIHGPIPAGEQIILNPLLFAAWVGVFITSLNLIPVGQLDGGHILYALMRKKAYPVAVACLALAVGYMSYRGTATYGLLVVLLFLMGPFHPETGDDEAPLGWPRYLIGWATLAFIIIGFTPDPINVLGG